MWECDYPRNLAAFFYFITGEMPDKENGEMPEDTNTNTAANQQQNSQQSQTQTSETPIVFDEWLKAQPEQVKAAYTAHVTGLQNTVKATREERDGLARQIKELSGKVEKGSETEKALSEISTKLEAAERKASFVEEAVKPEIGCSNPKAAFVIAEAQNLFTRAGAPDWAAIKAAAPELFQKSTARGNAGSGTQEPPAKVSMNDFIRRSTGH